MSSVKVRDIESFESALRHFKKKCEREGILSEVKKREYYEKPSIKKNRKILAARKKGIKRTRVVFSRSR
ncbi:30S ribosomal protein S21 [Thermodesulfovibrionales bacterium]|nr:30S ribosomal protein S21 [Thermodesulfovibrionales bacterium]MCL0061222.1 30S ribosomal protein S21 [Thermodesulfovibrionales bacterium]